MGGDNESGFRPQCAGSNISVCGVPPGLRQPDWTDQRVALALADRALDDELTAALEQSRGVSAQIAALDALFLRRAAQFAQPRGPALAQAVARSGAQRVRDAASYWGYSERQLGRLFGEMLGLRVKTYLRLLSVNRILKYAYHNRGSLAALAQEAGYFDQAHFVHEFRSICGVMPTAYFKNLSGF